MLGVRYVEKRDAAALTAFCFAGLLLAQVRYESVIFLLPVTLVVLWTWSREGRPVLSWPILVAPLLMVLLRNAQPEVRRLALEKSRFIRTMVHEFRSPLGAIKGMLEVILDKSQKTQKYSASTFLANAHIPTYIDAEHAIAHNKIIIIDNETVITGSFNFTKAAEERNAENLLIIRDSEMAKRYTENWVKHEGHGEQYGGR